MIGPAGDAGCPRSIPVGMELGVEIVAPLRCLDPDEFDATAPNLLPVDFSLIARHINAMDGKIVRSRVRELEPRACGDRNDHEKGKHSSNHSSIRQPAPTRPRD